MKLTEKRKNLIFAVIVVTCILCSMLSTALTTALPGIMEDFGITAATGQWLTSVYSLVMGILVLATAFLIKRFKTKKLYLASLGIFTLGILLDAFTGSFAIMMIGRILQAAGNGILLSLGQVVLLTIFEKEKRGSVMGVYGLAVAAAPVIAPTLAGIIVDAFGWRMIFVVLLPLLVLSLLFGVFSIRQVSETKKISFQIVDYLLIAAGFACFIFATSMASEAGWTSVRVIVLFLVSILAIAVFYRRSIRSDAPLVDVKVFRCVPFFLSVVTLLLIQFICLGLGYLIQCHLVNTKCPEWLDCL